MDLYHRAAYKFEALKVGLERYTTSFLTSPEWLRHICILHTLKNIIRNRKNPSSACPFVRLSDTLLSRSPVKTLKKRFC